MLQQWRLQEDSGGYSQEAGEVTEENSAMNKYLKSLRDSENGLRKPASAAGLSKKFAGGDPIGVSSDNLFHMIHRAYKKKRQENIFIEDYIHVSR